MFFMIKEEYYLLRIKELKTENRKLRSRENKLRGIKWTGRKVEQQ